MNIVVEFTKDFATYKKGENCEYPSQFASRLIREGVAKKKSESEKPKRVRRTKAEIEADKKAE